MAEKETKIEFKKEKSKTDLQTGLENLKGELDKLNTKGNTKKLSDEMLTNLLDHKEDFRSVLTAEQIIALNEQKPGIVFDIFSDPVKDKVNTFTINFGKGEKVNKWAINNVGLAFADPRFKSVKVSIPEESEKEGTRMADGSFFTADHKYISILNDYEVTLEEGKNDKIVKKEIKTIEAVPQEIFELAKKNGIHPFIIAALYLLNPKEYFEFMGEDDKNVRAYLLMKKLQILANKFEAQSKKPFNEDGKSNPEFLGLIVKALKINKGDFEKNYKNVSGEEINIPEVVYNFEKKEKYKGDKAFSIHRPWNEEKTAASLTRPSTMTIRKISREEDRDILTNINGRPMSELNGEQSYAFARAVFGDGQGAKCLSEIDRYFGGNGSMVKVETALGTHENGLRFYQDTGGDISGNGGNRGTYQINATDIEGIKSMYNTSINKCARIYEDLTGNELNISNLSAADKDILCHLGFICMKGEYMINRLIAIRNGRITDKRARLSACDQYIKENYDLNDKYIIFKLLAKYNELPEEVAIDLVHNKIQGGAQWVWAKDKQGNRYKKEIIIGKDTRWMAADKGLTIDTGRLQNHIKPEDKITNSPELITENILGPETLCVGDSHTERYCQGTKATNIAKVGASSGEVLAMLRDSPISRGIKKAVVMVGTNDIRNGAENVFKNIEAIVAELRNKYPKADIKVCTIPPVKEFAGNNKSVVTQTDILNEKIRTTFADNSIDLYTVLATTDGKFKPELRGDPIHFNANGSKLVRDTIQSSFERDNKLS